ncbi:MAG: hypothetical protein QXX77_09550 [Candidatus Methanosuratincola sp.]|jgi:hypothetical protein
MVEGQGRAFGVDEFRKSIERLAAQRNRGCPREESRDDEGGDRSPTKRAIDELFGLGERGVELYNGAVGSEELYILKTPCRLLSSFFGFSGYPYGFAIFGDLRYVLFMGAPSVDVVVVGRDAVRREGVSLTALRQLISLTVEESLGALRYKDSTGALVSPSEIMVLTIGWVTGG